MKDNFLFHKISKSELDSIKNQAKEIMMSFSDKISEVDLPERGDEIIRDVSMRGEGLSDVPLMNQKLFFGNAHSKKGDFILVERKEW